MNRRLAEGSPVWRVAPQQVGGLSGRRQRAVSTPPRHRPRVLSVTFDAILLAALDANPDESFDRSFYASDQWPTRANSTFRLDIVNYLALARIGDDVEIEWVSDRDLPREVVDFFDGYDVVIIHQIRTPRAMSSLRRILAQLRARGSTTHIVFGTELSWFNELRKGALTREELRYVFTKCTVLRHTAKTEIGAYRKRSLGDIRVQEFEIGIDTQVVERLQGWRARSGILFVPAPAGRATKNNEAIDHVRAAIEASHDLRYLPVSVLEPPYSSVDYWQRASRVRYVISTSRGETFSYVVNDAKACGAITFFPAGMFANDAGTFVLDSYPDDGIRYTSVDDLIAKLEGFEKSAVRRRSASRTARREVVSRFSVDVIANNWRRVILGESLNDESAVLADLRSGYPSMDSALAFCRQLGAKYLVSVHNGGLDPFARAGFAWKDRASGVIVVKHWAYEHEGYLRPIRGVGEFGVAALPGAEEVPDPLTTEMQYWRLFVRLYKVSKLWVDQELGPEIVDRLSDIRVFDGIGRDLRGLEVASIAW